MRNLLLIVLVFVAATLCAQTNTYSSKELENWRNIGQGNGFVTYGQFLMEEIEGSKGFMLLSPEKYKDVVLRYEVMTLSEATVLVAILNASDVGNSIDLTLNESSDNFGFWTKVEDYMFAFRVQAHNSTPFLRKHPALKGESSQIGLAQKNIMHSGWRYKVECGKQGKRLWLKIDGEAIIDVEDDKPLEAGKIAIRVRGTANELGKCMIRNLEIEGTPVR